MAVAGPVAKPHLSIISTGNKHLAGWQANFAFKTELQINKPGEQYGMHSLKISDIHVEMRCCTVWME